jgi:hypothetical protein
LKTATRKAECIFCSAPRVTKEHVWPNWVKGLIPGDGPFTVTTVSDAPGAVSRSWTKAELDVTVKRVCQPCNNGWLSRLEDEAKSLLTDIVQGRPVVLTPLDQERLAVWAYKTALILALTNRSGEPYFTDEEYVVFKSNQSPAPSTRIWLATYDGPHATWYRKKLVSVTLETTGESRDGHVMVATLGRVVIVQLSSRWVQFNWSIPPSSARFLVPLWPLASGSRTWPPPDALNDLGLQQLFEIVSGRNDGQGKKA